MKTLVEAVQNSEPWICQISLIQIYLGTVISMALLSSSQGSLSVYQSFCDLTGPAVGLLIWRG